MAGVLHDIVGAEGSPLPVGGGRSLAVESGGRLWACYKRSIGGFDEIAASYSDDDGKTWTEEIITNADATQTRPTIAIDSSDTVFVVWHGIGWGTNTGVNNIRFSRRTFGGSWTSALAITDSTDEQIAPVIAIDSDDSVFFLWFGRGYGTFPTKTQLVSRKRLVGGSQESIQEITDFNVGAPSQRDVSVAIDSTDDVHAVWSGGATQLLYSKRNGAWSAATALFQNTSPQRVPTIAIDSSDDLHVVWADTTPNPIILYYIKQTSGVWGTEEVLTDDDDAFSPSLSVDSSDNLHLLYNWEFSGNVQSIFYIKKDAVGWTPKENIYTQPEGQGPPHALFAIHPASTHILASKVLFVFTRQDSTGVFVAFGSIQLLRFPEDSTGQVRVTTIRHIYRPGMFRMQAGLGDVSASLGIAEHVARAELTRPEQPLVKVPTEVAASQPSMAGGPGTWPIKWLGEVPVEEDAEPIFIPTLPGIITRPDVLRGLLKPTLTTGAPTLGQVLGATFRASLLTGTIKTLWNAVTPWKEEEDETLVGEITKRVARVLRLRGGGRR